MKQKSLAKLKKDLWKHFSLLVRDEGKGICFTCGARCEGKNAHAGHFIKRAVGGLNLYFNPLNVKLQCARCNLWLDGNQYEYGIRLGKKTVKKLKELQKEKPQWDRYTYELLITAAKKDYATYVKVYNDLQAAREKIKKNLK